MSWPAHKVFSALVVAAFMCHSSGRAEIRLMPREELVDRADYIGVVQVVAVRKRHLSRVRGLAREATVAVQDTVKGQQASTLIIAFDNGLMCPNVQYEQGATYLVFLERAGNDRYVTVNHEQGRAVIKNGRVPAWQPDDHVGTQVSDVLEELRAYVARSRNDA